MGNKAQVVDNAFSAVLQDYLDELKRRNYSWRTLAGARHTLNGFFVFIMGLRVARIQDVNESHLSRYRLFMNDIKHYTEYSAINRMYRIKTFFDTIAKNQVVFINPAENMPRLRKPVRLHVIPTEKEMALLLNQPDISCSLGIRDRAIMEIFYSTGMRCDELFRLNINDPQLRFSRLRVFGKGRKERVVPLGKHALYWLDRYLKEVRPRYQRNPDELALWLGESCGRRLNDQIIRVGIRTYWRKTGIKTRITPHTFRRACATHMLRNGAHPVQIQMLLGHADLSSLAQYLQVTIKDMQKMHKASKLGK